MTVYKPTKVLKKWLGERIIVVGRKSRLKKERRELEQHGLIERTANTLLLFGEHNQSIYRFFKKSGKLMPLRVAKFG
nr:hypothetical protein [Ningiella sp. W23]